MSVTLLYFDGCPSWQDAAARLRQAMRTAHRPVSELRIERVTTPEDADRVRFRGSPTILVDGQDPFADAAAPVGLACRRFMTPDGLQGAPTVDQLLEALR